MGSKWDIFMFTTTLLLVLQMFSFVGAKRIGVCYGLNGDNLPSPTDVINLYKKSGIEYLKIYEPYPEVLDALRGSGLLVAVGPKNEDVPHLAQTADAASEWVKANIAPYAGSISFRWITIGNEIIPGENSSFVAQAIQSMHDALSSAGLDNIIVTTVVSKNVLGSVLRKTGAPLMINVYPYFAYAADPSHISLDYALFNSSKAVVDGHFKYYNLFDAMVDAFHAPLERINSEDVKIIIAESGWSSDGNPPFSSIENAETYNKRFYDHVTQQGTPKRPGDVMEAFFFEMFNEDMKPTEVDKHFGFFYPNMQPVYPFW
ncbi:putative glucan endo-1,3-beta-glucosidase GVI [Carica papaya]|uniref:putative glucan endo-1,3-beta-glucosidase GVI n=1 Tax=Carica papaya TaxID=3649 RepID=UPI000B8CF130|nr:putative glucan endo-1,3-beta-glucosidase GVI [Carica papaya]